MRRGGHDTCTWLNDTTVVTPSMLVRMADGGDDDSCVVQPRAGVSAPRRGRVWARAPSEDAREHWLACSAAESVGQAHTSARRLSCWSRRTGRLHAPAPKVRGRSRSCRHTRLRRPLVVLQSSRLEQCCVLELQSSLSFSAPYRDCQRPTPSQPCPSSLSEPLRSLGL